METSNYPEMPPISFSINGIKKLLQSLNVNKANGPDKILIRVLKDYATEIAPILQHIFMQSLSTGCLPHDWKTANITPIFKKGDQNLPSNYRPISLTAVPCKLLEHIIHKNIMEHLELHNAIVHFQHGFRTGHSCESQLIITIEEIMRSLDQKNQIDIAILDFSKAFDSVPHKRLLKKLDYYGIRGQNLGWIAAWLEERTQRVVLNGEQSREVPVISGVPQGTVLGPLMFLLYVNDIGKDVNSSIKLFADDCLLYRNVNSEDDASLLQQDLDKLVKWSKTWQMSFNINKCHILRVHRSQIPLINNYTMEHKPVSDVNHCPYLGVEMQSNMKFDRHIVNMCNKATRTFNMLRRNLHHCSPQIKEISYKALIRPILEYSAAVWDPHRLKEKQQIERIQRRAARWVKCDYSRDTSVSGLLEQLQWPTLEKRRKISRLTIFYKMLSSKNEIAIPIPQYVEVPGYATRRASQSNFTTIRPNTDSYKFSFLPRTIREWADVPPDTKTADSVDGFKLKLFKLYA